MHAACMIWAALIQRAAKAKAKTDAYASSSPSSSIVTTIFHPSYQIPTPDHFLRPDLLLIFCSTADLRPHLQPDGSPHRFLHDFHSSAAAWSLREIGSRVAVLLTAKKAYNTTKVEAHADLLSRAYVHPVYRTAQTPLQPKP